MFLKTEGNEYLITGDTSRLVLEGLFTTVTNVNFNNDTITELIRRVEKERERLVPDCFVCTVSCGKNNNYDMNNLWEAGEDVRSLKSLILFGIRGVAAYAYHAAVLGYTDDTINRFFFKALFAIGMDDWGMDELLPIVLEVGEINLKCMALLDRANTETYGNPVPTQVSLTVEKGPFIVISGHDLYDLKQLLEQTKDKGINIYTHGEMLPAHAYPKLKKYPHLKGNFGTAWQNQQKEFANLPAPVLFTTNCLMPPKASYADRVFTTEVVAFPDTVHIGEDKDFTPVIEKALELGGGNFGTAWQNQQKEFADIPAPVLFTTNCLMPPKKSYADRVFTTEVVSYPEMVHIGKERDFTPVIEKALSLGGYPEDMHFTGINGGKTVMTGFSHHAVLSVADTVIDAVKSGAIKHFFLVGGCDGAKPGRNYYTEFVKQTPADSIVLTLACGKYRFNDLDLGTIGGLPRIMDMGQCNDAYSAIKVAVALAEAFDCGVNDLPLSMVLSWYEQKAVCILLTLLHLGIKNILLGPSLPAFISPNVLQYLVENYNIAPISTPEEDLRRCMSL